VASKQVIMPGTGKRKQLLAAVLTVAVMLVPAVAAAQPQEMPPRPRARVMLQSAQDCYRRGDYEGAARFFQEAQDADSAKQQLTPAERADLAQQTKDNSNALASSRDGAARLRQAEEALKRNDLKLAEAVVKAESSNTYLRPEDRALLEQLTTQLRARGVSGLAGAATVKNTTPSPTPAAKEDYRTLVTKARKSYESRSYDEAEMLAKQAEKVGGGIIPWWLHPWDDNHGKVLRDVQDARTKIAAEKKAHDLGSKLPEKQADSPSFWMQPIVMVKSLFAPATPAPKDPPQLRPNDKDIPPPIPPGGPPPGNVVSGPAVTPMAQMPKLPAEQLPAQVTPETLKIRELVAQGEAALKNNDLVTARRCAEQAKAIPSNAFWETQKVDLLLVEVQKRQPVQQASASIPEVKTNPPTAAPAAMDMTTSRTKLKEGRALYSQNRFDEAERICAQITAAKLAQKWGLFEDNPESLRRDIVKARQKADQAESVKLLLEGRKLLGAGNYQEARIKAWRARTLHGPYTFWDVGDRPDRLLAEIDSAEARQHKSTDPLKSNDNIANKDNHQKQSNAGLKDTPPATTSGLAAKQRALALLADARTLEKQGKLVDAQRKALEAHGLAIDAYRGGAGFVFGEDTPDMVLQMLAMQCRERIMSLVHVADQNIGDKAQLPKAMASLEEARQLALAFQQDTSVVDQKLQWVGQHLGQVVQVVDAQPAAGGIGQELLEQSRIALRAGKTKEARKFAELAFDMKYGVQPQAHALLNSIDAEEFNQKRLETDRAFIAGYDAFLHHDYRKARGIFEQINESQLNPENQKRMRELALDPNMQLKAPPDVPQKLIAASGFPDGPPGGPPGMQHVTDMANTGDSTTGFERIRAMQKIEFDMLTKDGLQTQQRALQKAEAGDLDGAVAILRNYDATLSQSKLDTEQIAKLKRPIERYIQQFQTRKAQLEWTKQQNGDLAGGAQRERDRVQKQQKQDSEIARLIQDCNQLMKEGKFQHAHTVAMQAHDLDPDNPSIYSLLYITNMRMQEQHNDLVKERKDRIFDEGLDDDPGPIVTMKKPWVFDSAHHEKMKKRMGVDHITSDMHDPVEKKIARAVDERKVTVNFNNTPLEHAVIDLRALVGDINIVFDEAALQEEGIRKDQPLSLAVNGLTLRSLLNIMLSNAKLTWVIQNQTITITTEAHAQGKRVTATYSVADLVVPIDNHPSLQGMAEEWRWKDAINHYARGGVTYSGTQPFANPFGLPPGTPVGSPTGPGGQVNTLGGSQVPKPVPGQTLEELLIRLITTTIAPETWSSQGGKGTINYYPLGLALIVGQQTLDIQQEIQDLLQALRRLQDLEVAIEMRLVSVSEAFFERIGVDFSMNILHGSTRFEPELLSGNFRPAQLINQFRPSNFWSGLTPAGTFTPDLGVPIATHSFDFGIPPFGGYPGTIGADGGLSLGLAFLSDIQVFMFMEAAQGDRRTNIMQAPKITVFNGQTAAITVGDELYFLTSIDAINANGQLVFQPVQTPQFYGVNMTVTPVVSADRRFVRLNLNPTLRNLVSATVPLLPVQQQVPQLFFDGISPPQPVLFQNFFQQPGGATITLNTTVVVPDGGTVLMGGLKTLVEARNEFGPPVLSKIPYLSRLFKNVGYGREAQSLMIMVTARIIINEEEEAEFTGAIPRIPR
jgi:type II secretory pathway component GspD/PulD (secretin)